MSSQNTHIGDKKVQLLKEAAEALDHAQKRDDAVKLAFDMVELGKIPPFQSYGEFQEKVAQIVSKDLNVVKEALNMDASMANFGKVASEGIAPTDATAAFFSRLAED